MKVAAIASRCFVVASLLYCCAEARRCPVFHAAVGTQRTGCYIVVLKDATSGEQFQAVLDKVVGMAEDTKLYGRVSVVAKAFTVKLSSDALYKVCHHMLISNLTLYTL